MLPNHTPLKVAETFRVLEALHPGRVDLGLGRAPGTDPLTALALRRSREALERRRFSRAPRRPARVSRSRLPAESSASNAFAPCRTTCPCPKSGCSARAIFPPSFPRRWDCASPSRITFSRGRPSPRCACTAKIFSPSEYLAKPEALIGVSVVCAETDERAEELARPLALTLLRFRTGKMGALPEHRGGHELPVLAARSADHAR